MKERKKKTKNDRKALDMILSALEYILFPEATLFDSKLRFPGRLVRS